MNIDQMGWRDKLDKLELDADPGLVPLIVSIRGDMEIMAGIALGHVHTLQSLYEVRRQLLDLLAVRQEHRADV